MSLVNNLLNPVPTVSADQGERVYKVTAADLINGGAFTTVDIVLDNYPAGATLMTSRIRPLVAVTGTSITASTARLYFGKAGSETAVGSGAVDAFQTIGTVEGTNEIASTTPVAGDGWAANRLLMRVTTTGGNLSAVTTGSIEAAANVAEGGL